MLAEAVQLASKCCLTLSVSTIGGNHSQAIPGEDRKTPKTDRGEESRQDCSRSAVMKYVCRHDVAWSSTDPSFFLAALTFLTAKTKSAQSAYRLVKASGNDSHSLRFKVK